MKEFMYKFLGYKFLKNFEIFPFFFFSGFFLYGGIYFSGLDFEYYKGFTPLATNSNGTSIARLAIDLYFAVSAIYISVIFLKMDNEKLENVIFYIENESKYKRPFLMSFTFYIVILVYFFYNNSPYGRIAFVPQKEWILFIFMPFLAFSTAHISVIFISYVRRALK